MIPPKPPARADKVSLLTYLRLFRADILSAQPARLYHAWMAEFRTLFFHSFLINDPALIARVLTDEPELFPKSNRIREGLTPLLGNSVFVTNGDAWKRQRRIIDPAFEGGRLRLTFPAILAAAKAAVLRMPEGRVEIEAEASHAAADVIFRTLFSIPIDHAVAAGVFQEFRRYQRSQPILNLAAFLPLPKWVPRLHRRQTKRSAKAIRDMIARLTIERAGEIAQGTAPDDLATKIMTEVDPLTGESFKPAEMVDQVAIFFLAGHETSASALAWALLMLALAPDIQERVAAEVASLPDAPDFSDIARLRFTRDVFRETLRLYPPVPMMVREASCPVHFRSRKVPKGAQIVISPWHLHRHERLWTEPDSFDPDRWSRDENRVPAREAFIPFSAGPRVCPGAGFAMIEGPLLLALLVKDFCFSPAPGAEITPVAHLTVRSKSGIPLIVERRA